MITKRIGVVFWRSNCGKTKSTEIVKWKKEKRGAFISEINLLANSKLFTKLNVG